VIALIAAFVPLTEIVKLVNIGTLFAFVIVNLGVIILRRTRPDLQRGFRVPFVPGFPIIGTLLCLYLMRYLDRDTWIRFFVWLIIGVAIYFVYGAGTRGSGRGRWRTRRPSSAERLRTGGRPSRARAPSERRPSRPGRGWRPAPPRARPPR
jgi:amino acid transporter